MRPDPNRFNATLTARNYGEKKVVVERIAYGIEIEADSDTTRHHVAFYAKKVVPTAFEITVVCRSFEEYENVGNWLKGYGDKVSGGTAQAATMRVQVPAFKFDRLGIPQGGITFGDRLDAVVYRFRLSFLGTQDPLAEGAASQFKDASAEDRAIPYFYPVNQLRGQEEGEDLLYQRSKTVDHLLEAAPPPVPEPEPVFVVKPKPFGENEVAPAPFPISPGRPPGGTGSA